MKKLLPLFIVLMCVASLFGQKAGDFSLPSKMDIEPAVKANYPAEYASQYQVLMPGFYPIGWSRDGKFAYFFEPVDEACGCYFAKIVIQDMKTDKVLWEFNNDPESRHDKDGGVAEDNKDLFWQRNKKLFSGKLTEHGIGADKKFEMLGKNFTSGKRSFSAEIKLTKKHSEDFGIDAVETSELFLSAKGLGKKSINKGSAFFTTMDISVAGALKSPYEGRVAIVLLYLKRGWEGPPHTIDIQTFGADLKSGFGK